jgi:hypothetical protein
VKNTIVLSAVVKKNTIVLSKIVKKNTIVLSAVVCFPHNFRQDNGVFLTTLGKTMVFFSQL